MMFSFSELNKIVSTHSRLKAAGDRISATTDSSSVSTHSRLKAAGGRQQLPLRFRLCFNTQPPEGGWAEKWRMSGRTNGFQHTAA